MIQISEKLYLNLSHLLAEIQRSGTLYIEPKTDYLVQLDRVTVDRMAAELADVSRETRPGQAGDLVVGDSYV